ncbi:uncharacterized protein LOC102803631 [Saccoglossus kowalevskii]
MADIQLKPSEIYFLHDSIKGQFRDGRHLLDTFKELLYKRISPSQIEKIVVYSANSKWRVYAGNRRLYIYKKLEVLGVVEYITAWKVLTLNPYTLRKRDTTKNGGASVRIRNDPLFEGKITWIVEEWKTWATKASIQGQTAADDIGQNGAYISDWQQDRQDCIGFSSRALHTPGHEPCDYIDEQGKQTTSIKGQTAEDDIGQTRGYFNSWQKDHQDYNASSSHVLYSPIQKPSHNSFQTHTPSHAFVEHGKETASIQGQTAADDIGQNGAYISDLQQDRQDCIGFSSRALHTPGHEPCDYIDEKGKQTSKIRLFFLNTYEYSIDCHLFIKMTEILVF